MDRHDWDERYRRELVWSAEPNRFLVAEVEGLTPGRALDVACGEGRNAIWLAEQGWTVTGVDFSEVALDKARRLAAARGVSVTLGARRRHRLHARPRALRSRDRPAISTCPRRPDASCSAAPRPPSRRAGPCSWWDTTSPTPSVGWGGPQDPAVLYGPDDVAADLDGLDIVKATTGRTSRDHRRGRQDRHRRLGARHSTAVGATP